MNRKYFFALLCAASVFALSCSDDATVGKVIQEPCDTEGQTQCNSKGERLVCTGGYFAVSPCDEGEGCLSGQCVPHCDTSTFAVKCDGNDRIYCSPEGFMLQEPCPAGQVCSGGICQNPGGITPPAGENNVGDPCDETFKTSCNGEGKRLVCVDNKIAAESCKDGEVCKDGQCVNDDNPGLNDKTPCESDAFTPRCTGQQTVIACIDGFEQEQKCAENQICSENGCTDTCTEDLKACSESGKRLTCKNGRVTVTACAETQRCVDGECANTCTDDYFGCSADGTTRLFCKDGIIMSDLCPNGLVCDVKDGKCTTPEDKAECKAEEFEAACNKEGKTVNCIDGKIVIAQCQENQTCYLGKCEEDVPCSTSTYTPICLEDGMRKICLNGKETRVHCGDGETCEGGICQNIANAPACTGDEVSCDSANIAKKCVDGVWHKYYCPVENQVCSAGACIDKESAVACSETTHTASCDENTKLLCEYGYIAKYDCGDGRHCDDGECYDNIHIGDTCDEAAFVKQCLPDGSLAVCTDGHIASHDCGEKTCHAGACVTCTDENFTPACSGDHAAKVCVDGIVKSSACADAQHCENGICLDDPKDGDACVTADHKTICSTDGSVIACVDDKIVITKCEGDTPYCMTDKCVACNPAGYGKQCREENGQAVTSTCSADGSLLESNCAADAVCFKNDCAQCDPAKYAISCTDKTERKYCDENGMIKTQKCPAGEFCHEGSCTSNCTSNEDCGAHYICKENICIFQAECTPGAVACTDDAKSTRLCAAPGLWQDTACKAGEICENAKCLGTECKGTGKTFCDGNTPAECVDGYLKPISSECSGTDAVCVDGVCMQCKHGTSPNVCLSSGEFKVCREDNTYSVELCGANYKCDKDKGCVSRCGEGFADHCTADGKREYCDGGTIKTEECSFSEQCVGGVCKSKIGTPCDYNTFEPKCVTDSENNVYVEMCDKGSEGIQYSSCNNADHFCGTLDSLTGCFQKCDDVNIMTCSHSTTPNSIGEVGPCVEGKDYQNNKVLGLRLAPGYCKNGFSSSCYTDNLGRAQFNHLFCPLLGGGTGAAVCEEKSGACPDFATASCTTPNGQCSDNHAINCQLDPASIGKTNVNGYVRTDMDCGRLGAVCVTYTKEGQTHTTATCKDKREFKYEDNHIIEISSLGTCDGNILRTLYWSGVKNPMAWSIDCQEKTCTTATNNGVTYSYCK